jgi:RimJ/RimL family protein N-acetyltransferase
MTEQQTASSLDLETLRRAVEDLDAELLASLYAEDAQASFVGPGAPPSSPYEQSGKQEIMETHCRVFEEDIRQHIENEVIGKDRVAFTIPAVYPEGKRELCAVFLDLDEEGKIICQTIVQARDEE